MRYLHDQRRGFPIKLRRAQSDGKLHKIRRYSFHICGQEHFQIRAQLPPDIFKYLRGHIGTPFLLSDPLEHDILLIPELTEQGTFIHSRRPGYILRGRGYIALITD